MSAPDWSSEAVEAARARIEVLFEACDRLTPDELARIGCRPARDDEREPLLAAVDEAAERTGRTVLVDLARTRVQESLLRRYADGMLHPTWCGLTWGISQGTVADRVAIVETIADAAAAAVVEDVLDQAVAQALAQDAADLLGLAAGRASEWSLAHALSRPADPDLGSSHGWQLGLLAVMIVLTALTGAAGVVILMVGIVQLARWSATVRSGPVAAPRA